MPSTSRTRTPATAGSSPRTEVRSFVALTGAATWASAGACQTKRRVMPKTKAAVARCTLPTLTPDVRIRTKRSVPGSAL